MTANAAHALQSLDEAKASLASGDTARAVRALATAWAKIPSSRIGALVIRLSSTLPHEALPAKVADRESRWLELAHSQNLDVVPALLSVEWPAFPRAVKARLDALEKFPPDPRIAGSLRDLWHARAYRSQAGSVFWRRAFRMLLHWNDPGTAAILSLAKRDDEYGILQSVVDRRTKTPLPAEPALTDDIAKRMDEIEALAGTPAEKMTKEQMLDRIYENPRDDGARLVLADLLVAEGDPRGELIQLQSALASGRDAKGKMTARVTTLLATLGRKWLDGLDAMVTQRPAFHLGFASSVTLDKAIDPTPRAWRTVHTIRFDRFDQQTSADPFLHENLANVTSVIGIPIRTLAFWLSRCGARELDVIEACGTLDPMLSCAAHIRHLSVRGGVVRQGSLRVRYGYVETFKWFERSALATHVDMLELDPIDRDANDLDMLKRTLPIAIADLVRTPTLRSIWLRPGNERAIEGPEDIRPILWDVLISRDETRAPTVFEVAWNGRNIYSVKLRDAVMSIVSALEALSTPITKLDVRMNDALDPNLHDSLMKELERFRTSSASRA